MKEQGNKLIFQLKRKSLTELYSELGTMTQGLTVV